jgi:glycosyltransferase involved in cell wall biosynthesis
MKSICLVTNYNYAEYLEECLLSLVSQTRKFDRILIIDDGSSDASREIISRFCRDCSYASTVDKDNGGQLSCFNAALEFIDTDDFVFFIDADDVYPPDYLEQVSPFIAKDHADFIFVNPVRFSDGEQPLKSACVGPEKGFAFSSTSALTRRIRCCIGVETSCLCIKGSLYHALLPYPYEKDWITQADDLLTIGASIVGARKLYIESLGISYRIHASNNFAGKRISPHEQANERLRRERLFRWYSDRAMLPLRAPLKNAIHEAVLIPHRIRRRFSIPSPAQIFLFDLIMSASIIKLLFKNPAGDNHS